MDTRPPTGRRLRLGGLLSGGGRTLLNILEQIRSGRLDAEVSAVVASRDCAGVERCRQEGLAVHVVAYREMPDIETYSARIVEHLDAAGVDLALQAGFLSLWQIPERYAGRVMNIHPALLPSFGGRGMFGLRVHRAVLAAGCKVSGCTVHFADDAYDSGPIIVQKAVAVCEGDTPESLAARVFEAECEAYPEAVSLFAAGRLEVTDGVVHVRTSTTDTST
jgi:formyltetrahydrofolate-dependent phosphoribosylglycinamide formyltransferase